MTIITFPPPDRLLSLNDRTHWRAHAAAVKAWRETAWGHTLEQVPPPRAHGPSVVYVDLPVTSRRRRDPSNLLATVKPIVDGMTDAGCWPDDDSQWVAVTEPTVTIGSNLVVVRIEPRGLS